MLREILEFFREICLGSVIVLPKQMDGTIDLSHKNQISIPSPHVHEEDKPIGEVDFYESFT